MTGKSLSPSWERRVVLVRHGETMSNREKRFQGHRDVPLSDLGEQQARATGERLVRDFRISYCVSSDLSRAAETARAIAKATNSTLVFEPDLREANLGTLEGQPWDRAAELLGDESGYLDRLSLHAAPPGGESPMAVRRRCQRFVRSLLRRIDNLPSGDIALVAHGGSLRALLPVLLGLPPAGGWVFRFDNCGVTSVLMRHDRPPLLVAYNDCSHLNV